jgi:hypothetical protein
MLTYSLPHSLSSHDKEDLVSGTLAGAKLHVMDIIGAGAAVVAAS